jgi:hypothetical protein
MSARCEGQLRVVATCSKIVNFASAMASGFGRLIVGLSCFKLFGWRRGHCRLDYGIGNWVEAKRIHGVGITVEDLNNSIEKKRQCSILLLG